MTVSLHPQNDRVGTAGLPGPAGVMYRQPPVFVTRYGACKHETPLCPHVQGRPHQMLCREEALYVYGERWCDTCRMHRYTSRESGWTDPRYQGGDADGE